MQLGEMLKKAGVFVPLLLFSLLQWLQFVFVKLGKAVPQLDFLTFLVAVYLLYSEIHFYIFGANRPAWRHPTTAGVFSQSVTALTVAWGFLFFSEPALHRTLGFILLVTILLRILTMWSRLRYLNRASQVTRQTVQLLLNRFFMLFTVRFVFGLAMPLVYLVWGLWFSALPFQVVALMILVGELSDRILFFLTAIPVGATREIEETNN